MVRTLDVELVLHHLATGHTRILPYRRRPAAALTEALGRPAHRVAGTYSAPPLGRPAERLLVEGCRPQDGGHGARKP
jgi:hypothetical protein